MKQIKTTIIILITLLASQKILAKEMLDLDSFRNRALKNSEDLTIARHKEEQTQYQKKEQFSNYFPKFSAQGQYLHMSEKLKKSTPDTYLPTYNFDPSTGDLTPNLQLDAEGNMIYDSNGNPVFQSYGFVPAMDFTLNLQNVFQYGISLEQPLYLGGKIITANKMAAIGNKISKIKVEAKKEDIILNADTKYWQYVAVSEKVKVAKKYVNLLDSLLIQVNEAINAGLVHRNKRLKVQVKLNQAKLQLEKALNGQQLLSMALCQMIGLDIHTEIMVKDSSIQITSQPKPIDTSKIVKQRPDYQMLEKVVDLKKSNVDLIRSDFLPQAGLKASYNFVNGIKLNGSDVFSSDGGASVVLSVNIPLFQWGEGYNKVKAAQVETKIAQTSIQKYQKMMTLEIEQALLSLKEAHTRYQNSIQNLKHAEENLALSKDSYNNGLELLTDYMESQAEWQNAYADLIEAKADCKIKESKYKKAIGKL